MDDDQIRSLLRTLEDDRTPDPAFANALYQRLQVVADARRPSRAPFLLAAAALLTILAAGLAVGSGLLRLPETVDASGSPSPNTTGLAVASPSAPTSSVAPAPSGSAQASAEPDTVVPPGSILFAEADGLRIRSEASESAEVVATIRSGQHMAATGARQTIEGMDWYEVRIGPGDLHGWLAAGPDHGWVRLVDDGAIGFICEGGCGTASLVSVTPLADAAIKAISNEAYREWTWSPDGTRIAATFDGGNAGEAEIVVIDADGSDRQRLGEGYGPAWSPDGRRLAWSVGRTLVVTERDLVPTELDLELRSAGTPMWSPDGASLAFGAIDCPGCPVDEPIIGDAPSATWIVGADGSGLRQLTGGDYSGLVDWSPDGTTLAFVQVDLSGEFPMRAYTLPVTGGERSYLEDGGAIAGGPTWSPGGQFLLYATPEDIVITAGDGSTARRVVRSNEMGVGSLAWSPSARWIVLRSLAIVDAVEQPGIFVAPVDGSEPAFQISPREASVSREAWQPVLVPLR